MIKLIEIIKLITIYQLSKMTKKIKVGYHKKIQEKYKMASLITEKSKLVGHLINWDQLLLYNNMYHKELEIY